jgi:hypothetical protein
MNCCTSISPYNGWFTADREVLHKIVSNSKVDRRKTKIAQENNSYFNPNQHTYKKTTQTTSRSYETIDIA